MTNVCERLSVEVLLKRGQPEYHRFQWNMMVDDIRKVVLEPQTLAGTPVAIRKMYEEGTLRGEVNQTPSRFPGEWMVATSMTVQGYRTWGMIMMDMHRIMGIIGEKCSRAAGCYEYEGGPMMRQVGQCVNCGGGFQPAVDQGGQVRNTCSDACAYGALCKAMGV